MEKLPEITSQLVTTNGQRSISSSPKPDAAKMEEARQSVKRMLSSYPDYGRAPAEYLLTLTEFVAGLTEIEKSIVFDWKNGVTARTKFLPTIADMTEVINEFTAKRKQFEPAHTAYRRFEPEAPLPPEETDLERRKRVVQELLGYNPQAKDTPVKRVLVPPTAEDLANLKSKLPPPGPPTRELREVIARQDGMNRSKA